MFSFCKMTKPKKIRKKMMINQKRLYRLWKTAWWMIRMIPTILNLTKSKAFKAPSSIISLEDSTLPPFRNILCNQVKFDNSFFYSIQKILSRMRINHLNHLKLNNQFLIFQTSPKSYHSTKHKNFKKETRLFYQKKINRFRVPAK